MMDKAIVSTTPFKDGDGYSYGSDVYLVYDYHSILIGANNQANRDFAYFIRDAINEKLETQQTKG